MSSHTGEWTLNASTHSLDWNIPIISSEDKSGTLEFTVGGDDVGTFFPVKVAFVAQGSLIDIGIGSVSRQDTGEDVPFSQDVTISSDEYLII